MIDDRFTFWKMFYLLKWVVCLFAVNIFCECVGVLCTLALTYVREIVPESLFIFERGFQIPIRPPPADPHNPWARVVWKMSLSSSKWEHSVLA